MSDPARCTCTRCTIRGLMGPVVVTTIGVLFLLSETAGGRLSFSHTYPMLFIVIGGILFASAMAPMDGHIGPGNGVAPPPSSAPPPAAPPPGYPASFQGQGQ